MSNLRIRPATVGDRFALGRIIVDATHSAFQGRVPDACLRWLDVAESAQNWGNSIENLPATEHLLVAEMADREVAGLILAGRSTAEVVRAAAIATRYPIEITSLQVAPAWQRKGLGRRLIGTAAARMLEQGSSSLLVRVLRDNPNMAFYERMGARHVGSQPYNWAGYDTHEELLVWDDIQCLTAS